MPLIGMFLMECLASETMMLLSFPPGLLIAMVSINPAALISPINPNLLPVSSFAISSALLATSSPLLQVRAL